MDGCVAPRAIPGRLEAQAAVRRLDRVRTARVASHAQRPDLARLQHHAVGGPVRVVTSNAPFDFDRSVLKHPGAALFCVASDAGFPVCPGEEPLIFRAMRIVTIGALHQPFGNTVMGGQREGRLDRGMAGEAQIRLRFPEQVIAQPLVLFAGLGQPEKFRLRQGGFHSLARIPADH